MKTKDIKSQLNKETGNNTPDILESVKISPINKLKKHEKNLVAFKKSIATLILAFLLIIVVVLAVAIHGLTTQHPATIENFTFLSLRICDKDDADGLESDDLEIYNFILDDNGKILLVYNENSLQKMSTPNEYSDVLDLIECNGDSRIYIIGASDSPAFARQFARGMESCFARDEEYKDITFVNHINDSISKSIAGKSLSLLPNYNSDLLSNDNSINKICELYVSLVG